MFERFDKIFSGLGFPGKISSEGGGFWSDRKND